ncbi:MAG: hypothetical protein JWM11_1327 [Planctomycetaceae bacterium]|nr:hypothetical protein [Planctomycetaceae bacterium]
MGLLQDWTWDREGVSLYDDHLLWYEQLGPVAFASGAACEQTLKNFLKHGPQYPEIPREILAELTKAVNALVASQ